MMRYSRKEEILKEPYIEKNMSYLQNVIVEICQEKGWSYEYHTKEKEVLFKVPISNGREQVVTAKLSDTEFGEVIDIISRAGGFNRNMQKDTLIDLLKFNNALVYSRTEINENETGVYLVGRTLGGCANQEEIAVMIEEVALSADGVEQEVFGTDIE